MLNPKQIRKMARPMTDRQICNRSNEPLVITDTLWGDKTLLFFESPPTVAREWYLIDERSDRGEETLREAIQDTTAQLFPTFIGGTEHGQTILKFSTTQDEHVNVEARFVSTTLKKAKRHAQAITWYQFTIGATKGVLAELAGQPVASFAKLDEPDYEPRDGWTWTLQNNDLPRRPETPTPVDLTAAWQTAKW